MNITGKQTALCLLFLTMATLWWGLFSAEPIQAQSTGSLETECVAVVSADSSIAPPTVTPQEFCKVLVALVGNEWTKAAKLQATILVVNDHDVRLAAAEAAIAALQAQSSATLQPQIDAISTKLANVANALQ
ncbi:hypothetical protein LCGC14_0466730 [marine sediment metagenome]|uniref:Uncharacterized protein n=1 Tax=marine sediment metagenome TaxID=412755 RepID=A0A0F9VMA9_9ZZZZ